MDRASVSDRGQQLQAGAASKSQGMRCFAAARMGSVEVTAQEFSFWLQVRGNAWIEAREGKFRLGAGDWIAFPKDSKPVVQADRDGLCIGVVLPDTALRSMTRFNDFALYVGRGHENTRDTRTLARLWYRTAKLAPGMAAEDRIHASVRLLLLQLEQMQRECRKRLSLCPGASLARKRQVFERMQRACLYMQGNSHRAVSITELAERTQFSIWYFSKVFHKVYGESAQVFSARLRLAQAAQLLASTPLTIGEVGAACGFENNCSFARRFRAHFGMTASDYRNAVASPPVLASQTCSPSRANHIAATREPVRSVVETDLPHSSHKVSERLTRL